MTPSHAEKPILPSIQFLLQQDAPCEANKLSSTGPRPPPSSLSTGHANPIPSRHRSSHSVSSLPEELQSLSLYAPTNSLHTSTPNYKDDLALLGKPVHRSPPQSYVPTAPSWLRSGEDQQTTLLAPIAPQSVQLPYLTPRRPPGASHSRSVSEFTLPHSSINMPKNCQPISASATPASASTRHHHAHRRAASTSTVDFGHPSPHQEARAQSCSPEARSPPLDDGELIKDAATGKYVCPFCHKKFSRPSSLRIHTYSHTGEKPFRCEEEGCGRRFSVQSNMRRHLRVHRLERTSPK